MSERRVDINPDQKKAVEFGDGAMLVVAGAGTGKTRVITRRIKWLMEKKKISHKQILALTFTEKAAEEMTLRVEDVMPLGYEEPWICTFHSFADRILREKGLEIGLDPSYKILSGSDQWLLFRKHLFDFDLKYFRPLGNPTKFISAILKFVSRCQDEEIFPEDLFQYAQTSADLEDKDRWLELASVYKKYEELKTSQSKLDFGDLIIWTLKLFRKRQNILKEYRRQFAHVLVDEFQDTNYAQYDLIKLLCPPGELSARSLLVVGDDSQSIYKFRGAAVSNILEFRKDYPSSDTTTLLSNYRSTQDILDAAYLLVRNNDPDTLEAKLGISKKLVSPTQKIGHRPTALRAQTWGEEAELVVLKILEMLAKQPSYTYKDFAVLARANSHLDPFVFALRKYGIPYQLIGNRGLYDRDEVRDIVALIRVAVNRWDAASLYRALNIDSFDIDGNVISQLLSQSRHEKLHLWSIVESSSDDKVAFFVKIILKTQDSITKSSPSELVYSLVSAVNYISQFLREETVENQLCIKNLDLFLNRTREFEVSYRQDYKQIPTIIDWLNHLDLMMEAGENPAQAQIEDIDTVNLLTVHASKGLEFSVVFMVNLVSDRFPTRNRTDVIEIPDVLVKETLPIGDAHIQEERRLFYVGMTRAKEHLFFTLAKTYGGAREKIPSGFIEEAGISVRDVYPDEAGQKQLGLFGLESGFRNPKLAKIEGFAPDFVSYSQLRAYKTCPLQYKYRYVLSIPTPPNHALSFGSTVHDTLRDFHTALMFGKVALNELFDMYEKNWQPAGYLDEKHRSLRFESGKKLLEDYWRVHKDVSVKPAALEKSFTVKIDGIKLYGKIDRIDPLSGGKVEIIDYKTGTPMDQEEVDKDDQVTYYAIGAKEGLGLDPGKLTYFFLEGGVRISTERTAKQVGEKKKEVVEIVGKIREGKFAATPGVHCGWCDFKNICPFAQKS